MAKLTTWFGEYNANSEESLKRLSKDLGVRYQTTMKEGKQLFRFVNLDEQRSLRLISTIRKYGLAARTVHPLSEQLRDNLEALNKVTQND